MHVYRFSSPGAATWANMANLQCADHDRDSTMDLERVTEQFSPPNQGSVIKNDRWAARSCHPTLRNVMTFGGGLAISLVSQ